MPETIQKHRNRSVWLGLLLALSAVLCNAALFAGLPGARAITQLSVLLALLALIFFAKGLHGVFAQAPTRPGKVAGSIISLASLLFTGFAFFIFFHARALPASTRAPQVGQKAPDFTLTDTAGQPISLDDLFLSAPGPPPKAVLLIFYRGYW